VTLPGRYLPARRTLLALSLGLAMAACSSGGGGGATSGAGSGPGPSSTMTVSSTAFQPNAAIPVRYTCKGANTSPPLRWSAPPSGTTELALVVDDPDAPGGTFVHWVLYGIPASQTQLAEGSVPSRATQGRNSAGSGYTGPCPPSGPAHHYRFTVYALSRSPGVTPDDDPGRAIDAIRQAASAQGQLVGTFAT
jgi:Raf kinase inhibitor-like YbhB/YbcL family protein